MSWWSNLFGGEERRAARDGEAEAQSDRSRILQMREGIAAAAAALPEEHAALGRDAVEVAEAIAARAGAGAGSGSHPAGRDAASAPGEDAPSRASDEEDAGRKLADLRGEAIEELGRLHFDIIRLEVEEADPERLGISERLDGLRELADRMEGGPS